MDVNWDEYHHRGIDFRLSRPSDWQVIPDVAGAMLAITPSLPEAARFAPNVTVVFAEGSSDPLEHVHGNLGQMRARLRNFATTEVKQDPVALGRFTVAGTYDHEDWHLKLWQLYAIGASGSVIVTATCAEADEDRFAPLLHQIARSIQLTPQAEASLGIVPAGEDGASSGPAAS